MMIETVVLPDTREEITVWALEQNPGKTFAQELLSQQLATADPSYARFSGHLLLLIESQLDQWVAFIQQTYPDLVKEVEYATHTRISVAGRVVSSPR